MIRESVLEFLNSEETYNNILSLIEKECDTQNVTLNDYSLDYFLCGGAVANTIYYILNTHKFDKPIINDVDLFYFNKIEDRFNYYNLWDPNCYIQQNINSKTHIDEYSRVWVSSCGEEMRMVRSERFGFINKITINVNTFTNDFTQSSYYKQLIENFDLNCCQVGLDRVNKKIIYTEDFLEFILTDLIEVTVMSSPLQTTLRLWNKTNQLMTNSANLEDEIRLLQHYFINYTTNKIGNEWLSKFNDNREFLEKYYYLVNFNELNDLHTYSSKTFVIEDIIDKLKFDVNHSNIIPIWDAFVRGKDYAKNIKDVVKFVNDDLVEPKYPSLIYYLSQSPKFFECSFTHDDLIKVSRFIKLLYTEVFIPSSFLVENVEKQIVFIDFFNKKFMNRDGSIKKDLLTKVIIKLNNSYFDNIEMTKPFLNSKINIINKTLESLWFKNKLLTFKFKQNIF